MYILKLIYRNGDTGYVGRLPNASELIPLCPSEPDIFRRAKGYTHVYRLVSPAYAQQIVDGIRSGHLMASYERPEFILLERDLLQRATETHTNPIFKFFKGIYE